MGAGLPAGIRMQLSGSGEDKAQQGRASGTCVPNRLVDVIPACSNQDAVRGVRDDLDAMLKSGPDRLAQSQQMLRLVRLQWISFLAPESGACRSLHPGTNLPNQLVLRALGQQEQQRV